MLRHAMLVLGLIGGISACKGLGGLASGLGHVASGVARAVPKVAGEAAQVASHAVPVVARATLHAVPDVIRAVDIVGAVETSGDPVEVEVGVDAPDPCDACPMTVDCNSCTGYGGHVCEAVETRCVSP
jgi:hypothetical protein